MEYISIKLENNKNSLLIGQITQTQCNVYFQYELLNPLNELINDLSIKQSQSEFLTKIQDITSLIGFGLKPIGLNFKENLPEYCRNNSILKKICTIFNIDTLLLCTQGANFVFLLTQLQLVPINIKNKEFQLVNISLKTKLQINYESQQDFFSKLKQQYESLNLLYQDQICFNPQQQLQQLDNKTTYNFSFFKTSESKAYKENQNILQGDLLIHILTEKEITINNLKKLIIEDILMSLKPRLLENQQYPCYLAKRIKISFKNSPLILQNFLDQFNYNEEQKYIQQLFPNFEIDSINVLEDRQPFLFEKQPIIQQIEQKIQQNEQQLQNNQEQNQQQPINQPIIEEKKNKIKQEYLLMIGLFGILLAVYFQMIL